MDDSTISVTAIYDERNGTFFHTETHAVESKLEDIIGWARQKESNGRRLVQVVCAVGE